jgi:hypothetical protein
VIVLGLVLFGLTSEIFTNSYFIGFGFFGFFLGFL